MGPCRRRCRCRAVGDADTGCLHGVARAVRAEDEAADAAVVPAHEHCELRVALVAVVALAVRHPVQRTYKYHALMNTAHLQTPRTYECRAYKYRVHTNTVHL